MTPERLITWLIHSDWYLVAGWILVLAVAVVVTFTDLPASLFRSSESQPGTVPPEP